MLLSVSSVFIIQEDSKIMKLYNLVVSHQLFFSNNSLPGKSAQDEKMCIDLLKDLLLSELRLVNWPSRQEGGK